MLVQHKQSLEECLTLCTETIFSGHGTVINDPIPLIKKRLKKIDEKATNYRNNIKYGISTASEIAQYRYKHKYERHFPV